MRDCPLNRRVQEVTAEEEQEPEILFIGNVGMGEALCQPCGGAGGNRTRSEPARRPTATLGDLIRPRSWARPPKTVTPPTGLGRCKTLRGFEALEEDNDDVEECFIRNVEAEESEEVWIRNVDKQIGKKKGARREWASLGVGDIVVDSAADESCWPQGQGDAYEVKPSRRWILLRAANGSEMAHYGEKHIAIRGSDGEPLGLRFQVTDARKPLLAARRLVECGNEVNFATHDSFIRNTSTGKKIPLTKKGGSWVIRAEFIKDVAVEAEFSGQVTGAK